MVAFIFLDSLSQPLAISTSHNSELRPQRTIFTDRHIDIIFNLSRDT
jgi:hypothetical protein